MEETQEIVETNREMEKLAEKEEEKKIPVFTVLKNNAILKNIFLIDSPPPGPSSSNLVENKIPVAAEQKLEEILVVGRHPDCNITLEHPSISRFHLRIHSIPSKESLSVFDLSSVHGTWVCGKKIAPGVRVELHDGDVLQIGGSSRIYRLHWIPLSRAYGYDNPFLPRIEESDTVEEKEEIHQEDGGLSLQHDGQSWMEADDFLFTDMNIISQSKQLTPSAPPMPEDIESPFSYEEEAENKHPTAWEQDEEGIFVQYDQSQIEFDVLDGLDLLFTEMNVISEKTPVTSSASLMHKNREPLYFCEEEAENKNSFHLGKITGLQPDWLFERENSLSHAALASGQLQQESPENSPLRPQLSSVTSIWKRRGKSASVSVQTSMTAKRSNKTRVDYEVKLENSENLITESGQGVLFKSEGKIKEVFTPDKENCTPELLRSSKKFGQENRKHALSANSLTFSICEDEGAFTPDKENITPNTLLLRSLKRLEKIEEIKHSKTYRSSPLKNADSGIHQEVDKLGSSNCILQEKKLVKSTSRKRATLGAGVRVLKENADRVPFPSLLVSPNDKGPQTSKFEAAIRNCNSINNQQKGEAIHCFHKTHKEENKNWTMIVDAASLLNKESRKALQLMQGLQGTNLIIPRIVIRELDCMKRRGNLFRRTTDVCAALEWIEDCMVNAQSWIHVQSSIEDVRPIAPTPRASPSSCDMDMAEKFSFSSVPFSPCGSWLDIVSPTTEDHILECALFFRRIRNNWQLVLLSNDVTLKIKAMAEGLFCETVEEFRQSLVNPFSERFLWTNSSPRGTTWSCVDDVVLREKYYNGPIQRQSRSGEAAKGLKLILLHNTHFKQITSVR